MKKIILFIVSFMLFVVDVSSQTTTLSVHLGNPCQRITTINDEVNNHVLLIYPNPTSGIVTIELDSKFQTTKTQITVYDMIGRIVYETTIPKSTSLSLQMLTTGIYFINLKLNDLSITRKLIINK